MNLKLRHRLLLIVIGGFIGLLVVTEIASAQTFSEDSTILIELNGNSYNFYSTYTDNQPCIDAGKSYLPVCVYYHGSWDVNNEQDMYQYYVGVPYSNTVDSSFLATSTYGFTLFNFNINPNESMYSGLVNVFFTLDGDPVSFSFVQNPDGTISSINSTQQTVINVKPLNDTMIASTLIFVFIVGLALTIYFLKQ